MSQRFISTQKENFRIPVSPNMLKTQPKNKIELSTRFDKLPVIPLELLKKNTLPAIQTTKELSAALLPHEPTLPEQQTHTKNANFRQRLQKIRPKIHFLSELQKPVITTVNDPETLNQEMEQFKSKLEQISQLRDKLAKGKLKRQDRSISQIFRGRGLPQNTDHFSKEHSRSSWGYKLK